MPLFTKPQFNNVWASAGAKLAPEVAKINQGWVVEIPPHEFDNWMQNRQDALLAHLNQLGIPQWDSTVEYQAGKSYVQGTSTGIVYKALTTHSNVNPETDIQNNWVVAFEGSGNSLLKVNNLSDVPDKAQARINLGIATTEFYDGRYLLKSSNFSDVPNKATARTNLDVYGRAETYSRTEVESFIQAGKIEYWARSTAPPGTLVADGSAVSRTTYAKLFTAIGTFWGEGNGSTTFNLPNLLGEHIRGWDAGRGVDPGRHFGSVQLPQNMSHSHGVNDPSHVHEMIIPAKQNYSGAGPLAMVDGTKPIQTTHVQNTQPALTGISIGASGGSEVRVRNIALLPTISTGLLT